MEPVVTQEAREWIDIPVDEARDLARRWLPVTAYMFVGSVTESMRCFRNADGCVAALAPPNVFYKGLPWVVQVYASRPGAACGVINLDGLPLVLNQTLTYRSHDLSVSFSAACETRIQAQSRWELRTIRSAPCPNGAEVVSSAQRHSVARLYADAGPETRFHEGFFNEGPFVASWEDGECVGAYGVHFLAKPLGFAVTGHLYVRPAWRKRGIGEWLVASLSHQLKATGYHHLICDIEQGNTPSELIHRRVGFVPTGGSMQLNLLGTSLARDDVAG